MSQLRVTELRILSKEIDGGHDSCSKWSREPSRTKVPYQEGTQISLDL